MNGLKILHYTLQSLLCLAEIAGIIAGILAISRKKTLPGVLSVVGFLLLGLSLLFNVLLEQFRLFAARNFIDTLWVDPCLVAPAAFLGVVCLVIALFSATASRKTKTEEPSSE
jgi:hypothetical protein